jgi:hypothetical protein
MDLPPVPTSEDILDLYDRGALTAQLACHYEEENGEPNLFVQRCIALHNDGKIDFLKVVREPAFSNLTRHLFFTAQQYYCMAIPLLKCNCVDLMECCRILIKTAGPDLAATQPNAAFLKWCQNNPSDCMSIIGMARKGERLGIDFLTFALQATCDMELSIAFLEKYDDERRLSAITALSRIPISSVKNAHRCAEIIVPLVAHDHDAALRSNALVAALTILAVHPNAEICEALIEAATKQPQEQLLYALAEVIFRFQTILSIVDLRRLLYTLKAVNREQPHTLHVLDTALAALLATADADLAVNFLTCMIKEENVGFNDFPSTLLELARGDAQRIYDLLVRWFLSGSSALCSGVNSLLAEKNSFSFDQKIKCANLSQIQKYFLCRKAIGYLFLKPVLCSSIILSCLRENDPEAQDLLAGLLFDPMLMNYDGEMADYLKSILPDDPAYNFVQSALKKAEELYSKIKAVPPIKELHPSNRQHNVVHERIQDEFREAHKKADQKSIWQFIAHRSTVLYGARSVTYVQDYSGSHRAVEMDLKTISTSIEMPRREVYDPVGLNYMLRIFCAERLT